MYPGILQRRDDESSGYDGYYGPGLGPLLFTFAALIIAGSIFSFGLILLRRRRLAQRQAVLPQYQGYGHRHHRSASVTNLPQVARNERVFVYDEKMNLISNSSNSPPAEIPQILVTFPDEEGNGQNRPGRIVVVHVSDTGSVGLSPLQQEPAPPYQHSDAERFQSLDLDRMGGLREKNNGQQRYS